MNNYVDIVIVNYNTCLFLKKCIQSIRQYTRYPYRLIIIDNNSRDGSRSFLKRLNRKNITVIYNYKNVGCAKAWNQGIKASRGKYILFLNPDTYVSSDWLAKMVQCAEMDEKTAIVGNKQVNLQGVILHAGVIEKDEHAVFRGVGEKDSPEKFNQICDCIDVCGACYLVKRKYIDKIGFFDERFFMYAEETDYSFRAKRLGYRVVYCPVTIIHYGSGSPISPEEREKIHQRSCQLFDQKWFKGGKKNG